ncbi:MAG TPA: RusA family crossover junction endodeoxyribonuclease [Verrucomicrobiota bacterium]|nr:RusA family crossover junction endodeoxyribonuclease [Verrucomicrobiota bacterium]
MRQIEFFVAGEPKAQPRPRAFVRGGRARVYDPGTAEGWKGQVALAARDHLPFKPIDLAVAVHLRFHMPRPRGHYGRAGLKASAPEHHVGKPDVDNLAKAVLDALVAIGFLQDDRFVRSLLVTKRYANTAPGCDVRLTW